MTFSFGKDNGGIALFNKIDWYWLSGNSNPKAIELLKENPDNIDWENLSENPAAIELLKDNKDKK